MKKHLLRLGFVTSLLVVSTNLFSQVINLQKVGNYATGVFDEGATEIAAFDPATNYLFSVNGLTGNIDVIDINDVTNPVLAFTIDLSLYGGGANSVAFQNGVLAAAVEDTIKQNNGKAVFFDALGNYINQVTIGALPDMICFTPNGKKVLVANEGEPSSDYLVDPQGTVSIIDITAGVAFIDSSNVITLDFTAFDTITLSNEIRVFGPGALPSTDFEPEYISVSKNSKFAYVTLQENNAIATINLTTNQITTVKGLGFKNHALPGNEFDASDKNSGIVNITNWPVFGMYQPDAIEMVNIGGINYNVMANEGDVRDYDGFAEASRVNSVLLDSIAFPDSLDYQNDNNLGRLNITTTLGDIDNDGDFDKLYAFGARSFSIRLANGNLVYDSGNLIETLTNEIYPDNFNCSNTSNTKKGRSDDKGPEPEGLTTAKILDSTYLFLGLERISGVMVFNITNPYAPYFVQYINDRDFASTPAAGIGGAQGPEGLLFIPSTKSPNGKNLLVVSNEISGSISIFETDNTCGTGKILVCYDGITYCVKPSVASNLVSLGGTYGSCDGERFASEFQDDEILTNHISVYPNPANTNATISIQSIAGNSGKLSITNVTGAVVLEQFISMESMTATTAIDITHLTPGIYIINFMGSAETLSSKIIIE
jgi:2',3'-cyclic-nucleotide 2'-phosphodiesterase/3'-nucleotidase/5'-nucleotidase